MNLFLIVWEMQDWDSPEWTHIVSEKPYLSTSDEEKIIIDFMKENHEYSKEETLAILLDFWSNKVDKVDGHEITVEDIPQEYTAPFMEGLEESLDKLTIRKVQE